MPSAKTFLSPETLRVTTVDIDPCKGVFVLLLSYGISDGGEITTSNILENIRAFWSNTFPVSYPKVLVIDRSFSVFAHMLSRNQEAFEYLKRFVLTLQSFGFMVVVVNGQQISPFYPIANCNVAYLTETSWDCYASASIYYECENETITELPTIPDSVNRPFDRHIVVSGFAEVGKVTTLCKSLNTFWKIQVAAAKVKYPEGVLF